MTSLKSRMQKNLDKVLRDQFSKLLMTLFNSNYIFNWKFSLHFYLTASLESIMVISFII